MKKFASQLPRIALVLAIFLPVWFLMASFGGRMGLWSPLTGFATMTIKIGGILTIVTAVAAIAGLISAIAIKPRRGIAASCLALMVPVLVFVGFTQLRAQGQRVPFIYDIATDTADPPVFSDAMMALREKDEANPMIAFQKPLDQQEKWKGNAGVKGMTAAKLIAKDYPKMVSLEVDASVEGALEAVESAMEMRGFDNIEIDEATGRVEGTDTVFWYGFKDDIVARVRKQGKGSVIDFRSTSRVGLSDLGVNAGRIEDLQQAVRDRMAKGGDSIGKDDYGKVEEIQEALEHEGAQESEGDQPEEDQSDQ